ncbi:hypothetical protein L596_018274 [Steinernema carpocapsae]|uniref:Fork-head domain-containing protein n=1 Tax=Steinernema carpocapsae TaxID=34508 RepID=A0A4U5N563_STECR|nr:hypothetical protein L596_018274 [Steinernema carpocapsae]
MKAYKKQTHHSVAQRITVTMATKHQQNQYGLSFPGMIILAIQNSHITIRSAFCNRALSTRDIYKFVRVHVKPFQAMNAKQWDTTERKIRHSLSQTAYFQRYLPPTEPGSAGQVVPSKAAGAEKGSLWTLYPPQNKTHEQTQTMVNKVFVEHRVKVFKEHLVNPLILDQMLKGAWGWKNPYGEPLGNFEEKSKRTRNNSENAVCETPGTEEETQEIENTQVSLESSESSAATIENTNSVLSSEFPASSKTPFDPRIPTYAPQPFNPYPMYWTEQPFDHGHPQYFTYTPFPAQQVPIEPYSNLNQVQSGSQDPLFWNQGEGMPTQEVPMWPPAYFSQSKPSQEQNPIQECEDSPVYQDLDQAPPVAEPQQKKLGDPLDGDFHHFRDSFFAQPEF